MWFNSEFYQTADELAAELALLKERWGEEIVQRRVSVIRFKGLILPTGAVINSVHLRLDTRCPRNTSIYVEPGPQTNRTVTWGG